MKPYRCPTCGGSVIIMAASCQVLVGDDGAGEVLESEPLEWPDDAPARCYVPDCWRGYAFEAEADK